MSKYSKVDYNRYFDNAFIDNTPLEFLHLGELNLPTGQIVACDPLVGLWNTKPYTRTSAPGYYPVIACVAKTESSGDRFAIVKIEFDKEKAVRWELAVSEDDNTSQLKEDEYLGYAVDPGLGCFCDLETQQWYYKWGSEFMEKEPSSNIYDEFFAEEFKKNAIDQNDPDDIGDWLNFHLPNQPALNVIMFHSGYGDGWYPCFWGITNAGNVSSLIVDFQVL